MHLVYTKQDIHMVHVHSSLSRSVIVLTDGNDGSVTSQAVHLAIRKTTKADIQPRFVPPTTPAVGIKKTCRKPLQKCHLALRYAPIKYIFPSKEPKNKERVQPMPFAWTLDTTNTEHGSTNFSALSETVF